MEPASMRKSIHILCHILLHTSEPSFGRGEGGGGGGGGIHVLVSFCEMIPESWNQLNLRDREIMQVN